ncbi:MAG: hypothetical protein C4K60_04900 [Ideonella sp. MAG2]|nr:MAG: hypothetical protein C4K60_04900 [Ideonella sp. MAG2]
MATPGSKQGGSQPLCHGPQVLAVRWPPPTHHEHGKLDGSTQQRCAQHHTHQPVQPPQAKTSQEGLKAQGLPFAPGVAKDDLLMQAEGHCGQGQGQEAKFQGRGGPQRSGRGRAYGALWAKSPAPPRRQRRQSFGQEYQPGKALQLQAAARPPTL